jgi:hypothetical protein
MRLPAEQPRHPADKPGIPRTERMFTSDSGLSGPELDSIHPSAIEDSGNLKGSIYKKRKLQRACE